MKKRLTLTLISSLIIINSACADLAFTDPADFTGEAIFQSPSQKVKTSEVGDSSSHHTTPPIKQLRMMLQERSLQKELMKNELAPTASDLYSGEVGTSDYASKDLVDNFDENIEPSEEIEENEELLEDTDKKKSKKRKKASKTKDSEEVILDCEKVDYDTPNYLIKATGNVNVKFVKQGVTLKADVITFDRMNNTIKAEGNVRILKGGQTVTGEYIFVDLNEENALIEKPLMRTTNVEIRSEKGFVYGDKIVQENGSMVVDDSFPIDFRSGNRGPRIRRMLMPKETTLTDDMAKGIITIKSQDIKFAQKGDLETLQFKKLKVYRGDKLIFKTPGVKFYTNKNHDYGETNHWEIGSYRGLGLYTGPGFVFELPKGSVFKAIPMLNYKNEFGFGGVGRFSSGTNHTMMAYGTAMEKLMIYGKQLLDDDLFLHYGMNNYMDEWFMGRRRPKYGVSLVYNKDYSAQDFLLKGHTSGFKHRLEAGYFNDLDFDSHYEKLKGNDMGTSRFRYMAEARQNFYKYQNPEKLTALQFDIVAQMATSVYGTGDTQVLGRLAPTVRMQYKRWMQELGYYFSAFEDNTPMPVFDRFRYGKQSLYIREYFRLSKYLTISWFGNINTTNDAPNGKDLQENAFYISIGPDDIKFNLGYDYVRETFRCTIDVLMDAKGTKVEYDTFEIKQNKKAKKETKVAKKPSIDKKAPIQPKVLDKAVVENVKVLEDVL